MTAVHQDIIELRLRVLPAPGGHGLRRIAADEFYQGIGNSHQLEVAAHGTRRADLAPEIAADDADAVEAMIRAQQLHQAAAVARADFQDALGLQTQAGPDDHLVGLEEIGLVGQAQQFCVVRVCAVMRCEDAHIVEHHALEQFHLLQHGGSIPGHNNSFLR